MYKIIFITLTILFAAANARADGECKGINLKAGDTCANGTRLTSKQKICDGENLAKYGLKPRSYNEKDDSCDKGIVYPNTQKLCKSEPGDCKGMSKPFFSTYNENNDFCSQGKTFLRNGNGDNEACPKGTHPNSCKTFNNSKISKEKFCGIYEKQTP